MKPIQTLRVALVLVATAVFGVNSKAEPIDPTWIPITVSGFHQKLKASDNDITSALLTINQGAKCGYAIIAYRYYLNDVSSHPDSAAANICLSSASEQLWLFSLYGHSAIKCNSKQQAQVAKMWLSAAQRAYKLESTSALSVSTLGDALWTYGRMQHASADQSKGYELLKKAVRMNPNDGFAHSNLAVAMLESDFPNNHASEETLNQLKAAARFFPNSSAIHTLLSTAYSMNGDKADTQEQDIIARSLRMNMPITSEMTAIEPQLDE